MAGILLDQLIEQPEWVLPYLPKVVSKLAMVPGATMKSVQALKTCTSNVPRCIIISRSYIVHHSYILSTFIVIWLLDIA